MSNKMIIGKSSRKHVREKRREIVLSIIMENPTVKWSVRKIAEEAQQHPWFQEHMPSYSKSTAHLDLAHVMKEIKERRQDLAEEYIVQQLDIADDLISDLLAEYDELNDIDPEDIRDPGERASFVISRAKVKKDLVAAIDRMLARQSTLIPVTVPKRVEIDQRSITMNLDKFHEIQRQVEAEKRKAIEAEYEEGDYEELDN